MKCLAPFLLTTTLLAGCAHRGDLHATLADVPPAKLTQATGNAYVPAPPPPNWWHLFNDPVLDRLEGEALVANRDLAVSEANLERVRATVREQRGNLFPQTNVDAGVGYEGSQGVRLAPGYNLGGSLSYEVDLFGRVRSLIRAARGDARAADAAYQGVRLQVAADTAQAYSDGCGATRQLKVAKNTVQLQLQTLRLTQVQLAAGAVSPLDTARATSLLETSRATIPQFQAQQANAAFRLAVLTGRRPGTLPADATACVAPPTVRQPIPTGDGTAMLRRRPDVREQEANIYAAAARVGVAVGDLYPRFTLGASGSTTAGSIGSLFGAGGLTFSIGPALNFTFPNLVAARARLEEARATNRQTIAQFESTILVALRETETALNAYALELQRHQTLVRARDAAAEAARIVRLRYQIGRQNFLDVLDAERTRATAEAELAQSDAFVAGDQVEVFRTLGGGWEPDAVANPNPAAPGITLNPGAVVVPATHP